jgi:hypothetical protein
MGRIIEFRQKPTTRQVEQAGIEAERAVGLAIRLYRAKYGCSLPTRGAACSPGSERGQRSRREPSAAHVPQR